MKKTGYLNSIGEKKGITKKEEETLSYFAITDCSVKKLK